MLTVQPGLSKSCRFLFFAFLAFTFALCLESQAASAQELREILPLSQVRSGMQGYAYTIFAGDQVEKFDLEVIGVLDNFLGPKQSIILVQLKGPKVEHTGVVAGMSGSPVYLDGKLAGALSLKLGISWPAKRPAWCSCRATPPSIPHARSPQSRPIASTSAGIRL